MILPEGFEWVDMSDPVFKETYQDLLFSNRNLNLVGPAGSGKSLLIKLLMRYYGNASGVFVCATTGISAVSLTQDNIIAKTLHSFFRLKPLPYFPKTYLKKENHPEHTIKKIKVLIIDESSMMSSHLFDTLFNLIRMYRNVSNFPRIILFSDILQLPPVVSFNDPVVRQLYENEYGNNKMFFNGGYFKDLDFKTRYLTRIYRQGNDIRFQKILNNIREGKHTQEDLDVLNTRVIPIEEWDKQNEFFTHIVTTNKVAQQINAEYYNSFNTESKTFTRTESGTLDYSILNTIEKFTQLKIGLQAMCLVNNYNENYQNGTLGIIEDFEGAGDGTCLVLMRKENGQRIKVSINTYNFYEYKIVNGVLEPVIVGNARQIGCKVAKALTVHKCQGLTLNKIYFDAGTWLSDALVYVALSRVRKLEDLALARPLTMHDISANQESLEFLEELENEKTEIL